MATEVNRASNICIVERNPSVLQLAPTLDTSREITVMASQVEEKSSEIVHMRVMLRINSRKYVLFAASIPWQRASVAAVAPLSRGSCGWSGVPAMTPEMHSSIKMHKTAITPLLYKYKRASGQDIAIVLMVEAACSRTRRERFVALRTRVIPAIAGLCRVSNNAPWTEDPAMHCSNWNAAN